MSEEKPEYLTAVRSETGPKVSGSIAVQTLARAIKTAHENGALSFLAAHLTSLMAEHQTVDGPHTVVKLEGLIATAAKAMIKEPPD